MTNHRIITIRSVALACILALCAVLIMPAPTHAQASTSPDAEFFLQVTPSPLVAVVKPGVPTTLELKIHNAGSSPETLRIQPRAIKPDKLTGEVNLDDLSEPEITQWLKFSAPTFTVAPGATFTEIMTVALPKEAGFSYSFALLINRKDPPKATQGGRLLKGSIGVFCLINVDRPGATQSIDIPKFATTKSFYEYLPTSMEIQVKNTGNTIVQPYGNIYMQRGTDDREPITTLPVNEKHSYILPDTTRTLKADWTAGFPLKVNDKIVWDWSKVANLRIGRYTAKLVAVYNDGHRDVPVIQTVSFWVMPWKIIGGLLLGVLLVLLGIFSILNGIRRSVKRRRKRRAKAKQKSAAKESEVAADDDDSDDDD